MHYKTAVLAEELREREFEQTLLAEGIIRAIPHDWNDEEDFVPVEIIGKPLSETIIEDRSK